MSSIASQIEPNSSQKLPYSFARRVGAYLRHSSEGELELCHKGSLSPAILAEVRRFTQARFQCVQLSDTEFDQTMSASYEKNADNTQQMVDGLLGGELDLASIADTVTKTEDLLDQADDAPVIRLINAIVVDAIKASASDIHIETYESRLIVRYRVDGVLREVVQLNRELAPLLVSRIKVMAKLDIAEKRLPQDGRISLLIGGRDIDVRVSTMPSSNGERVVARILDKQTGQLGLDSLGMGDSQREQFEKLLAQSHGILLVTGPTGSGKSTSLYAGLNHINDRSRNILTVEDPIEYNIDGIGQTQVNVKAEMTFARGLRAMLRQDPDVVMVGEIRDVETAEIAVQASLTGHLVLSTLHTNSAIGAITRLRDMGIEPFLLASSLIGILAQRLVRVLCPDCKQAHKPSAMERDFLDVPLDPQQVIYHAVGCEHCNQMGYRGRTGIYEMVLIDERVRQLVHDGASEEDMLDYIRRSSPSIRADGRDKVLNGVTTVEEVLRVSREDA